MIRRLLRTYKDLPFVLIGDSGEEDPEIYLQAVREHPGRVKAVYIRDVTAGERDAEIAMADEARKLGTEMLAVPDTTAAAEHAASIGLIAPDAIAAVRAESAAGSSALVKNDTEAGHLGDAFVVPGYP